LKRVETVKELSQGSADVKMYFTPGDVPLRIET
jgi:hypothetical protein